MIWKYCPRCDRSFMGTDELSAFKAVADHVDKAHPEMQNETRDLVEEMEEDLKNGGSV